MTASLSPASWPVLVVDDDPMVRRLTQLILEPVRFDGRPLELLMANSVAEARALLSARPDCVMALVDVVMETETAGLDLTRWIRSRVEHSDLRVVIRTGQPGRLSLERVVDELGVQDVWEKAEVSAQQTRQRVKLLLRSHAELRTARDVAPPDGLRAHGGPEAAAAMVRALSPSFADGRLELRQLPDGMVLVPAAGRQWPVDVLRRAVSSVPGARWTLAPLGAVCPPGDWVGLQVCENTAAELGLPPQLLSLGAAPRWLSVACSPPASDDPLRELWSVAYMSRPVGGEAAVDRLLETLRTECAARNATAGVSGILLAANGVLMQVIEGPKDTVTALMERIAADPRHTGIEVLYDVQVPRRAFPWLPLHVQRLPRMAEERWAELVPRLREFSRTFRPTASDFLALIDPVLPDPPAPSPVAHPG